MDSLNHVSPFQDWSFAPWMLRSIHALMNPDVLYLRNNARYFGSVATMMDRGFEWEMKETLGVGELFHTLWKCNNSSWRRRQCFVTMALLSYPSVKLRWIRCQLSRKITDDLNTSRNWSSRTIRSFFTQLRCRRTGKAKRMPSRMGCNLDPIASDSDEEGHDKERAIYKLTKILLVGNLGHITNID